MSDGEQKKVQDKTIVVVGGGLAGLSAAVVVTRANAKLVLVEGQKYTGGNSAKATSGINGCDTEIQRKLKIHDSPDRFFEDTFSAGHRENDQALLDTLVHRAKDAIEFLIDLGVDLADVNLGGGHSVPRTHCFAAPTDGKVKPFGFTMMRMLFDKLKEFKSSYEAIGLNDRIEILTETKAESLLTTTDGKVIGVKVKGPDGKTRDISADGVILTTGGFCNDHSPNNDSLLVQYAGEKQFYPTTNGPFADGSGIKMALKLNAQLVDMTKIQIHPTGFVDPSDPVAPTKFLAAEALRGAGAILVNRDGKRFANELGYRDYLTGEILKKCSMNEASKTKTCFMIINDEAVDKFGRPSFEFYWKAKKFFQKAENVEQLAQLTNVPVKNLQNTLIEYNKLKAKSGSVDEFDKKVFPAALGPDQPLYVATITPVLHYSMGGLKMNEEAQILGSGDKPIRGLYGAGEVTGGVHGANRLSGNSLLECVVFGKIAADSAVRG